jgi:hypothetical protein
MTLLIGAMALKTNASKAWLLIVAAGSWAPNLREVRRGGK